VFRLLPSGADDEDVSVEVGGFAACSITTLIGVSAGIVITTCCVILILEICSSEASPMLFEILSRIRSDSLSGWSRLPRPKSIVPA